MSAHLFKSLFLRSLSRPPWRALQPHRALLGNTLTLIAASAATSGLGFVFWWVAARLYPAEVVGLASSAVSAMILLATVGMMGLGTLLISELPRQPERAGAFVTVSLILVGAVSFALSALFKPLAPHLAADLYPFVAGVTPFTLFALGVVLTALTMTLDKALIGLLRGELQLWRNILFAASKLAALLVAGVRFGNEFGLVIYAAWLLGNLFSLVVLAALLVRAGFRLWHRPAWGFVRGVKRLASHHLLNLALLTPGLILPILVTTLLSAETGAGFYAAWMLVSFLYVLPHHLTTVLHAVGAADPAALARKLRFTLRLSLLVGTVAAALLALGAGPILSLFGSVYAAEASLSLGILALGIYPNIIKVHYVAVARIHERVNQAALLMLGGGAAQLLLAALGASLGGLTGLSVGLLLGFGLEALITAPLLYRACISPTTSPHPTEAEATWSA